MSFDLESVQMLAQPWVICVVVIILVLLGMFVLPKSEQSKTASKPLTLEAALKSLGEAKYTEDGNHLDFDYFLNIMQTSMSITRGQSAEKDAEYVQKRRAMLAKG